VLLGGASVSSRRITRSRDRPPPSAVPSECPHGDPALGCGPPPTVDGFDHYFAAVYLNQLQPQAALDGLEAALDTFERLFGDLNSLPA
jgi:hypothetical protein